MQEAVHHLPGMALAMPEREIFSRLGFSRHRTRLSPEERAETNRLMRAGFALIHPRGVWRLVAVESVDAGGIHLAGGDVLASADLAARYRDATHIWFAGVTIGPELPQAAAAAMAASRLGEALIFDAVGGETADAAMDFLQQQASQELRRRGMALMQRRFSPGYGDWALEAQRSIFRLLPLAKIGVSLSERCVMAPEKSVTAISGVQRSLQE